MKVWIRRLLLAALALLLLAAALAAYGLWAAERKWNRRVEVAVKPVAVPTDAAALERGRYLYVSRGCAHCHGADAGGHLFVNEGGIRIAGPHIGQGEGSATPGYGNADWVRAIRHGVGPGGRPLRVMPSQDFNRLTDADVGALLAYIRSLPAVRGTAAVVELPLPVRVLFGLGRIPDAAERIDHRLAPERAVPEQRSIEHGRYVAQMCVGCHREDMAGGRIRGGPPDWPAAADLRPGEGGAMRRYPDAATFAAMMRSGRRPDGSAVRVMPFDSLAAMNDVDLEATFLYLKSLPPRPADGR